MELLTFDTWPLGPKLLVNLAQMRADNLGHAFVSGAHMASAVLEMEPVRQAFGDAAALAPIEAAVERCLLLSLKSRGKKPGFVGVLEQALRSGKPAPTADLFRTVLAEVSGLTKVLPALEAHATTIAALLDPPLVGELVFAPTGEPREGPDAARRASTRRTLDLVYADVAARKHRAVTTRHVLAGALRTWKVLLEKNGLPGTGDAQVRLDELLEKEPRADGALQVSPRFVGALASAVAITAQDPEAPLSFVLWRECLRGDDAVVFVHEALKDAMERVVEAKGAAGGSGAIS